MVQLRYGTMRIIIKMVSLDHVVVEETFSGLSNPQTFYIHTFRFHLLLYRTSVSSSVDLSFPSKANAISIN